MVKANNRALVVVALFMVGCSEDGNEAVPETPSTTLTLSLQAVGPIEHVYKLVVRLRPAHVFRPTPAIHREAANMQVFTDHNGDNKISTKPGIEPYSDVTLIDTAAPDSLPVVYIARNWSIYERNYGAREHVSVNFGGLIDNVRDSYLLLTDGRECEIKLIAPASPLNYRNNIHYRFAPFSIGPHEHWHIKLEVDFSATRINPAECARGYELQMAAGAVTIEQTEGA